MQGTAKRFQQIVEVFFSFPVSHNYNCYMQGSATPRRASVFLVGCKRATISLSRGEVGKLFQQIIFFSVVVKAGFFLHTV